MEAAAAIREGSVLSAKVRTLSVNKYNFTDASNNNSTASTASTGRHEFHRFHHPTPAHGHVKASLQLGQVVYSITGLLLLSR